MPAGRFLIQCRDRHLSDTVIESDGLTIGRLPGNDLVLNHRAVDETHAGIKEIGGRYWLSNLSNGNGLVVNGCLIAEAEVGHNDQLQIGPYLLRLALTPGALGITVEAGAGWHVEENRQAASDARSHVLAEAPALKVFWEKRKRESGKLTDQTILNPHGRRRLGKALSCWSPTVDLRQPWRSGLVLWIALGATLFSLLALAVWRNAYSPGPIAPPHLSTQLPPNALAKRTAGGACSACHSPIQGVSPQCEECHRAANFLPVISSAHRRAGLDCASCHHEHRQLNTTAVCLDCHTGRQPIRDGLRAGQTLGVPHPDGGYPVLNGRWRWKGLSPAEWRFKGLPESLAPRPASEQFHAVHRALRTPGTQNRLRCAECHGPGRPQAGLRITSCDSCHARDDCASCHAPHGSTRATRELLASLNGDFTRLKSAWKPRPAPHTPPPVPASFGALSWLGWTCLLAIPALAALVSLSLRATRPGLTPTAGAAAAIVDRAPESGGPVYPHPVIDPQLCIGCHACANACPHDVIAIVNGIATPVALDQCMEDTSCMAECPTSPKACIVVNTTKKIPPRRVPRRNQTFLTDVPGIYLIGDTSGVPLIKNAINEGAQVIESLRADLTDDSAGPGLDYDVAIIGVGAAGFSAAVNARAAGLKYIAIEQGEFASTLRGFPAGKYVFFKPETVAPKGPVPLPGVGGIKEELLASWDDLAQGLNLREGERCTAIRPLGGGGGFEIDTLGEAGQGQQLYRARRIILAIGNAGSPMKLGVPGEDLKIESTPKVRYRLSDPKDFAGRKCMVVGAGNSAIEAAVDLSRNGQPVTLVVRSDFKGDLKLGNKMNVYDAIDAGRIRVFFRTTIQEISETEVILADARTGEERARVENDFIFALIGSERPTKFLQSLGIRVEGDTVGSQNRIQDEEVSVGTLSVRPRF